MIPKLYELAKKIEQDRKYAIISSEETLTQKALMAVGTSAGGWFKKAIIAMDEDGNLFSGQASAREDRKDYIFKFNTPEFRLGDHSSICSHRQTGETPSIHKEERAL